MKSSDKELRLTALILSDLNLAMFSVHVSDICLSTFALKPAPERFAISPLFRPSNSSHEHPLYLL